MSQLPKEIVDKIEEDILRIYNWNMSTNSGSTYNAQAAGGYYEAALHYSQIIEDLKKENHEWLELRKIAPAMKWIEMYKNYNELLVQHDVAGWWQEQFQIANKEREQLKSENEGNKIIAGARAGAINDLQTIIEGKEKEISKLQSQIKGLVEALQDMVYWDEEKDDEWGDQGNRASVALANYYNSIK